MSHRGRSGDRAQRLVRWQVVFVKRGLEAAFPQHESMVDAGIGEQEFQNRVLAEWASGIDDETLPARWRDQAYPPGGRLPAGDGRYARVYSQVLACYGGGEGEGRERRADSLFDIAHAIRGEGGGATSCASLRAACWRARSTIASASSGTSSSACRRPSGSGRHRERRSSPASLRSPSASRMATGWTSTCATWGSARRSS